MYVLSWGGPEFGLKVNWPLALDSCISRMAGGDNVNCLGTWSYLLMEVVGWEWKSGC